MSNPDPLQTLHANLAALMNRNDDTQVSLAQKAGVAQRTVGALLGAYNRSDYSPGLAVIEAVAAAYGMQAWMLLLPGLTELLAENEGDRLAAMVSDYLKATPEGRATLQRLAKSEALHAHLLSAPTQS